MSSVVLKILEGKMKPKLQKYWFNAVSWSDSSDHSDPVGAPGILSCGRILELLWESPPGYLNQLNISQCQKDPYISHYRPLNN